MPTFQQQKLARELIKNTQRKKPLSKRQVVLKAGYTEITAEKNSSEVINSLGVKQSLEDYGFNVENAKRVVASILINEKTDPNPRLKAASEVFKVHGAYAPEKSINLNVEVESDEVIDELTQRLNDIYKGTSVLGNGESSGAVGLETQN